MGRSPRIGSGITAGASNDQPFEEVRPAERVLARFEIGQTAVGDADRRAAFICVSVISTVLAPGGRVSEPAWPQLITRRRGGSSSR